jgi:hypothetical protein
MKIILLSKKGNKVLGFDLLSGNKRHESTKWYDQSDKPTLIILLKVGIHSNS